MNITATRFATKARTWLLIAGLTGLLIAIGALIGGGALFLFVALAVLMNVAAYCAARATLETVTRLRRAVYFHTYRLGSLAVRTSGPGEASGEASPRCTDSQAAQSCRLVRSQKSTA